MKPMKVRIEILKKIFPYVNRFKVQWLLLLILKVGQKIPLLLSPLLLKLFIDNVLENKNIAYMWMISILCIGLFVLETVLKVLHRIIDNFLFNNITKELRMEIFCNLLSMSKKELNEYRISDIVRRLNFDIDMVKYFLVGQVFDYISFIIVAVSSTIMMFSLDWRLGIAGCLLIPISIMLSLLFENAIEEGAEEERKQLAEIDDSVEHIIKDWKEIKANHFEAYQERKFCSKLERLIDRKVRNTKIQFKRNVALDTKERVIDILGLYIIGGILSIFGNVYVGTMIACIGYYDNVLTNVREIIDTDSSLNWIKPSINRVIELLNKRIEENEFLLQDRVKDSQVIFEANDIIFSYSERDGRVIDHLSFKIMNGDKVLIDGSSGCGKSTLMQILVGDISIHSGEILFLERDIKSYSETQLNRVIHRIDNDTYFMNVTVADYLRMAKHNATENDLLDACSKVNLWQDLDYTTDLLNMRLGENGISFSKGQRQKLNLARVFLSNKEIIMMDEAFSAIDVYDKNLIMERLINEKCCTLICISHDEDIKRFFDNRIELNKSVQ